MKQEERNRLSFLKYGIPDDIIVKLIANNYTISKVRPASQKDLQSFLTQDEAKNVKAKLTRQEIDEAVFNRLVTQTELSCCFCWDITTDKPVIIHHIDPYEDTQDNSFNNLIVLCLNHHGEVHTNRQISQNNYPKIKQLTKKEEWIEALKKYKAGNRNAPGSEPKESKTVNVENSPGSVATIDQKGDNYVYNITVRQRRTLTEELAQEILQELNSMDVEGVMIRFEITGETRLLVGQLQQFLTSQNYKVYPNGVMMGELNVNEFRLMNHPSDPKTAKLCIGPFA
jgi:hypothetical protein